MLSFRMLPPPPALRESVAFFWTVQGRVAGLCSEMLFADARADLILDRTGTGGFGPAGRPAVLFAGAFGRPGRIQYQGSIDLLGVRFRTGTAQFIAGVSGASLANKAVRADEVLPPGELAELDSVLASSKDPPNALARLLIELQSRNYREPSFRPAPVLECLAQGMSPGATALVLNYSLRRLQRHFLDAVGLSMREAAGILRLRRAAVFLRTGMDLVDAMLLAGYSDQAHGTRAFRKLAGMTPGQFRRTRLPVMDGFVA